MFSGTEMLLNRFAVVVSVIALILPKTESTCSTGQGLIDNVCTACPAGTYASNNLCEKVPSGYYNQNASSTGYLTCSNSVLPGAASCNNVSNPTVVIAGSPSGVYGNGDGVGTNSFFYSPADLTIDTVSGDIYVAEWGNHAIRKISSSFAVITFAGSTLGPTGFGSNDGIGTNAKFNYPLGIQIDSVGDLFVMDTSNSRVRKITSNRGVSTFVGSVSGFQNGFGTNTKFYDPVGVTTFLDGDLLVSDYIGHRLRKVTLSRVVTTFSGSASNGYQDGTATNCRYNRPWGLDTEPGGTFIVADIYNTRLRRVSTNGDCSTLTGSDISGSSDGVGTAASFSYPWGVTITSVGLIYVSDGGNNNVRRVTSSGQVTTVTLTTTLSSPVGIGLDSSESLYVTEFDGHRITGMTIVSCSPGYFVTDSGACSSVSPGYYNANDTSGVYYYCPTANSSGMSSCSSCTSGHVVNYQCQACSAFQTGDGVNCYGLPSGQPSSQPSGQPSSQPSNNLNPTGKPSPQPSSGPSGQPSPQPSNRPTGKPSGQPSPQPSSGPSGQPSPQPSNRPTGKPSGQPSPQPSSGPSGEPSPQPSSWPSGEPSPQPSSQPSGEPSPQPSSGPSGEPSPQPSSQPSGQPSPQPSSQPSGQPSPRPSSHPSGRPTEQPSSQHPSCSTGQPLSQPSSRPSVQPSPQPSCYPTGTQLARPSWSHPSCQPLQKPLYRPSRKTARETSGTPSSPLSGHTSRSSRKQLSKPFSLSPGKPSSPLSNHLPLGQPSTLSSSQPSRKPSSRPTSGNPSFPPSTHHSGRLLPQSSCQLSGKISSQSGKQSTKGKPPGQPSPQPSSHTSGQSWYQSSNRLLEKPSSPPSNQHSGKSLSRRLKPASSPLPSQLSGKPSSRPTSQPSGKPSFPPSNHPSCKPSGNPSSSSPLRKPVIF